MSSASRIDFAETPFLAVWELTRDCELSCKYCLARALPPSTRELSTEEGCALLNDLAEMGTPFCALSGGDPVKRRDLPLLVRRGSELGLSIVATLAATPHLSEGLIGRLKAAGLAQMALNLDGPRESIHDGFRRAGGAFIQTLRCASYAEDAELPLQINTMFSGDNVRHFDAMAALVSMLRPVTWEVFLLVPIGAARTATRMSAQELDEFLERLAALSRSVNFEIKVSEAPQYCRYVMPETMYDQVDDLTMTPVRTESVFHAKARQDRSSNRTVRLARTKVNAGNGLVFINSSGDIYPSDFLPLPCGNVRRDPLQDVYRDHPTFRALRDPDFLKGKCQICEYRHICGGSRARAYAVTGDFLAEEPCCGYEPV